MIDSLDDLGIQSPEEIKVTHIIKETFSEEFIESHKDFLNGYSISKCQTLSEEFIESHKDFLDGHSISKCQTLSEDFIESHKDFLNGDWISKNQTPSEEFRERHDLPKPDPEKNWIEAKVEDKLPRLKKSPFEIKEDENGKYIECYKAVRDNLSSVYKPGLFYEVGETYETHCDCQLYFDNSFGLSGWTKEKALDYHDGRLLKVKIYVEDIGAVVHDGAKIRCFKQTILEEVT